MVVECWGYKQMVLELFWYRDEFLYFSLNLLLYVRSTDNIGYSCGAADGFIIDLKIRDDCPKTHGTSSYFFSSWVHDGNVRE